MTDLHTGFSKIKEVFSTTMASNYDTICQWTPNLVLSWGCGVLNANAYYKRRFGSSSLTPQSASATQFVLKDWLSARSGFIGTLTGTLCYWIGGVSFSDFRTIFLADQLYFSVLTYPYQIIDVENTVIPFFYPNFAQAPICTRTASPSDEKEIQTQQQAEELDLAYRPTYMAYYERQRPTSLPLSQRLYLNLKTPTYLDLNPFTGSFALMEDHSLSSRLAYYQAYCMTYYLKDFRDVFIQGYQALRFDFLNINSWIKSSKNKEKSTPLNDAKESIVSQAIQYRKKLDSSDHSILYSLTDNPKLTIPTLKEDDRHYIETYQIRRVLSNEPNKTKILITLPEDCSTNEFTYLIEKLRTVEHAELCFIQEWAVNKVHDAAAKLIQGIKEKRSSDLQPLKITYHDVNPKEALSENLKQALPADLNSNERVIYTVGMNNPNAIDVSNNSAHNMTLPQHKITAKRIFGTALAMVLTECTSDVLRVTMDKAWSSGTFLFLLNPQIIWDALFLVPTFCLKISVAPLELALYLTTMGYFYLTKKNQAVFELPSLSLSQTNSNMRFPQHLIYSNPQLQPTPRNTLDNSSNLRNTANSAELTTKLKKS